MASRATTILCIAVLAALLPATARATITPDGLPTDVRADTPTVAASAVAVAMGADGRYAVVYDWYRSGTSSCFLRRFSPTGAQQGATVPLGDTSAYCGATQVAMAPDGRLAVAFLQPGVVKVQPFAADGTAGTVRDLGAANQLQTGGVAIAPDGRITVAWSTFADGLRVRTLNADGTTLTGPTTIDSAAKSNPHPSIAVKPDGSFEIAWRPTTSGDSTTVRAQRFTATGAADGAAFDVANQPGRDLFFPSLGLAGDGSGRLAYTSRNGNGNNDQQDDTALQKIGTDGKASGDAKVLSETGRQDVRDLAVDTDGDALLVQETTPNSSTTPQSSVLQHFDPDGTADCPLTLGTRVGLTLTAGVDTNGAGKGVAAWLQPASDGTFAAFTQRFTYSAAVPCGGTPPPTTTTTTETTPTGTTPVETTTTTQTQTQTTPVQTTTTPPAVVPSATATPTPQPVKPSSTAPAAVSAPAKVADVVTLPSTRSCVSRRNFSIRLKVPKGAPVVSAAVALDGKQVAVRKGSRLRSTVDLRGLPKGRFAVKIVLTLKNGKKLQDTRRYRTCAPRKRRG